ncbi:Cys-tRNA(Pro) deacylase [Streptomyces cocklensis]|uniref:Cys-tRNA(Pro)/Cys-tRNA(Cys) deacylase n=1 Tax=Actinacidiphila cocklensis TaxID=887465 RepID=A0A9W4DTN7_9ACTN|nr:Cys-tRNA(Pro) deacylase [Actinacidiphila cocklensis]MDD1060442.1 Cys-tRNA(Pro) deacylase [Actinacidiphila cocklensis]WSX74019.1 Cys-tRNA(Pro) deacylase [Streptomyces sp. NBC_00899]WSX79916.1 Cys-tRNA(Pro) deacylase [Streptomyces sp. NBC_00899]CAG6395367.1 Cys-tRNA(Pro)/Cys-tRNA(Cys) deacylase YbaK [Actinacidiphila cocklensis]
MAKKRAGGAGGTPATVALEKAGVPFTVHSYTHDPPPEQGLGVPPSRFARGLSYGEEAAKALGTSPERVFKTLVADVDGALTVAVVPVAGSLDLKALAAAAGGKRAAMADPAAAERSSGYVLGGISPLGQRKALPTVLDSSAEGFETVFVSAGRRGLEVELAPADLRALTSAVSAPIARA